MVLDSPSRCKFVLRITRSASEQQLKATGGRAVFTQPCSINTQPAWVRLQHDQHPLFPSLSTVGFTAHRTKLPGNCVLIRNAPESYSPQQFSYWILSEAEADKISVQQGQRTVWDLGIEFLLQLMTWCMPCSSHCHTISVINPSCHHAVSGWSTRFASVPGKTQRCGTPARLRPSLFNEAYWGMGKMDKLVGEGKSVLKVQACCCLPWLCCRLHYVKVDKP